MQEVKPENSIMVAGIRSAFTPQRISALIVAQAAVDATYTHSPTPKRNQLVNAMMELGEYAGHRGYETYKPVKTNKLQAAIELADTMAFILSAVAETPAEKIDDVITTLSAVCEQEYRDLESVVEDDDFNTEESNVILLAVHGLAENLGTVFSALFHLANLYCGVSPEKLIRLYEAKTILNNFRTVNGYSQGTYVKQWGSQEDNVVMAELIVANVEMEDLEGRLADLYNLVPKGKLNA